VQTKLSRSRRLLLVAAVALVPAVAQAASLVRWSAPERIGAGVLNIPGPSAVNASGQAVTLRPGAGTGPALDLMTPGGRVRTVQLQGSATGICESQVAIDDRGDLGGVWDDSCTDSNTGPGRLEFVRGSFSSPPVAATVLAVPRGQSSGEQVFETPAGTAVALWDQDNAGGGSVRALVAAVGASIPAPVTLDDGATLVAAGVDRSGAVIVVDERNPQTTFVEHVISSVGTIGPAEPFSDAALSSATSTEDAVASVLVDGAGDQLLSWSWTAGNEHTQMAAQWRSAAGTLGAVQALGTTDAVDGYTPPIAVNAAGDAVAVLDPYHAGPLTVRFASRLGAFSTIRAIGAADRIANAASVTIDGGDRTLVTWLEGTAPGATAGREVYAEAHGMTFGAPAPLAVQPGLSATAVGYAPLAAAAPAAVQTVVTYAGSTRGGDVGQVAYAES